MSEVQARKLPDGWCWARLEDLCVKNTGTRDPRNTPDAEFRYVDISSVDNKAKCIVEPKKLLGQEAPSRARQIIRKNDVIVATTRPNLNAVAQVPDELDDEICSTGFCVLRATKAIEPAYLFSFVQTTEFVESLSDLVKGALYPAVTDGQVRAQYIPLPPLSEQKRIAALLTEQMTAIDRARAAAEAQLQAAKELPAAFLRSVFDSPKAKQWPVRPLSDVLASPLKTGISKPSVPDADKECLTLSAVRDGRLLLSECKSVEVSEREASGNWIKPGVFYVVRGNGNRSLVGRGGMAPTCMPNPILYPDLLIEVQANMDHVYPDYLRLVWDSERVREDIEARARTSAGIYKINQANLSEVRFPLPSPEEQTRISMMLDAQLCQARQAITLLRSQLDAINQLPAALLRKAFLGEL